MKKKMAFEWNESTISGITWIATHCHIFGLLMSLKCKAIFNISIIKILIIHIAINVFVI
jgi:hypothetical protein